MTDLGTEVPEAAPSWPSIDDVRPDEEGGPNARRGFNYQDEIAVSFLIDMLEDDTIIKIHCETHDDVVLIREDLALGTRSAEYIQVKAHEQNKLWSLADVCQRKNNQVGSSIFETSLGRDKHREVSLFRLVTFDPWSMRLSHSATSFHLIVVP